MLSPHMLERLHSRLGQPAWFWPAVIGFLLVGLPLIASALEATV